MLTRADYVPQETLFWRREVWERIGGLDESFQYALDWDMLLRMRMAGARFRRVPRFLGAFRIYEQQKTQRLLEVGQAETELLRRRTHGRSLTDSEIYSDLMWWRRQHLGFAGAHKLWRGWTILSGRATRISKL